MIVAPLVADFEQVGFGEWAPASGLDADQESVPEYRSMIYERRRHQIQYRRARIGGRTVLGRGDPDRLRGEPALAGLWAPVPRSGRFHLSGLPARGR